MYGASHSAVLVHSCCSRSSAASCSDLQAHKDNNIIWPWWWWRAVRDLLSWGEQWLCSLPLRCCMLQFSDLQEGCLVNYQNSLCDVLAAGSLKH